jgi:RNA polymerase sigma-70 factor, ECF subfamily
MRYNPEDDPLRMIEQIARCDRGAYQRFYDRYAPLVFSFASNILRSPSHAEDALQEVFLQVWEDAGSFDSGRGNPEAWLMKITRSRVTDLLRKLHRWDTLIDHLIALGRACEEPTWRPETDLMREETDRLIRAALEQLPEEQRVPLMLAYFGGTTQSEIAAHLNLPLGTVKTRMRAGLRRLRELLGDLLDGPGGGESDEP